MTDTLERQIVILGAGGHGGELCSYIQETAAGGEAIRLIGFVDDHKVPGPFLGSMILGGFRELEAFLSRHSHKPVYYITAAGDNRVRLAWVEKARGLEPKGLLPWTLRHPKAHVGCHVEIGEGACLAPGSAITTRVRLGRHCILNVNASISHDCVIGDFVNVNPAATLCGHVTIGEGSTIGAGATVIDNISIGEWSVIGAGAVVIDDVPPRVTAVGIPARVIKTQPP